MSTPITYLEQCKRFVRDLGINGGTFRAVTSTALIEAAVAGWIRDSDLYIQQLWVDWDFLWKTKTATVVISANTIPRESDLAHLDMDSLWLDYGLATALKPEFMEWEEFRKLHRSGVAITNDSPSHFSLQPDVAAAIQVSTTWAASTRTYYYEYWKDPVPMAADGDVSAITKYGEEMHRLIMARAKIMWAERENASEVTNSAAAEYEDLLPRLESMAHGQKRRQEYSLGSAGQPLVIVTP